MSTLPAISTIAQLRSARVKCIDFHPFKQQILVALHSGEIIVYDYQRNETVKTMALLPSPIRCAKYFADGVYFAVGSDDGHLRIYDSYNYQLRQNIRAHIDYLRSIVVHPSANVLVTAGDDAVIRAWSFNKTTAALELEAEYCGHDGAVMSISSDPQGLRLVSAGQDKTVKVWDISAFENLAEFRQKVADGRIGNQMGKRETTLLDKVNMKTVKNIAKQATDAVTNYVTNKPSPKLGDDFNPRVRFDALFTLNGHSGCVNSAVWCESSALSGGQENPYAQGCLQFIASCGDDQDLLIWDTYSRQVLKRLSPHQDVVNHVHFVRQLSLLVTLSADNSVSLFSTQEMQAERTLNFGLERGWCAASIQSGASTILALGFDAGVTVSRIGDFAPVCSFVGQKSSRLAVSGAFSRQYSRVENSFTVGGIASKTAGEIALCANVSKALEGEPEFKAVSDDLPPVIKALEFSPSGKLLAVLGEAKAAIVSALTGKKKFDISVKQFCFAAQFHPDDFTQADKPEKFEYEYESELETKGTYALVTEKQRRVVKIYEAASNEQEVLKIKTDFPVDRLFRGPLLGVANNESFVLYDWEEGKFITQLDMQVTSVIWNGAGDLAALVTPTETHILQVNFGQISASLGAEDYDEYNGVDNAVIELVSLPCAVNSGAFTTDSKLFVYLTAEGVQQLFLDEAIQGGSLASSSVSLNVPQLKQIIQVLGTYQVDEHTERIVLFGEAQNSYYSEAQFLYVAAVNVDKSVLKFKELVLQNKIEEALSYAKENLTSKSASEFAAEYLSKASASSDIVLELLSDTQSKLRFAHKLQRFDVVLQLAAEDPRLAADDAFRGGYIQEAAQLYIQVQDWAMALLCAYIIGDKELLHQIAAQCNDKNVQFRAGILLEDNDVCLKALVSPAQIAMFKKARDVLSPDDVEKWKQELQESNRGDVADLVE